ncbi:hypothetical protein BMW23_0054 [Bodo saltans virus]|uniref:U1-type domain-containing protein n=1 Tax=Bodo saltans virus TaxID=2024608 RepID=A0A2H4UTE2_9VIRU|nr:hypothetical protein QJ851_gp0053 [Bodo saltans virus]ATZ80116.1 hypothetical protein BMW23_0054 [Bodo saltans virus]
MLLPEEKNFLIKKKEELKKELNIINKKLRYDKCNEYHKKDDAKKYCETCNKNVNKYVYEKHVQSKTHIENLEKKKIYFEKKE